MQEKTSLQRPRLLTSLLMVVLGLAVLMIVGGYLFGWGWTGLTVPPTKTLWDWMQLLIIPGVLAGGGLWFNVQQSQRQQNLSDEQHKKDLELAEAQRKTESELAEQRRQADMDLALDQQRETALQTYLDRMAELLLQGKLRGSQVGDEIREVARARTLTVLRQLDKGRKAALLKFLYEAKLIESEKAIVSLNGADLSGADLTATDLSRAALVGANLSEARLIGAILVGANLSEATLRSANLFEADLSGANLSRASLSEGSLSGANLSRATLSDAYLSQADLSGANLVGANLSRATMNDAILSGANLSDADLNEAFLSHATLFEVNLCGASITSEQWEQASDLEGATLPDGTTYSKPA